MERKKEEKTVMEELKQQYPSIYKGFQDIVDEQFELFARKHLDYGMGNIAAGTQLQTPEEVEFALTGLWYRISDKVNRWKNLMITRKEGMKVQNETMLDTFQDITNYGIISQLVSRNLWKK